MKDKTGKLIVISAPSGTGKTTVVKKLLEKLLLLNPLKEKYWIKKLDI